MRCPGEAGRQFRQWQRMIDYRVAAKGAWWRHARGSGDRAIDQNV
ncbi:hypothetical protein [Sphingomonas sp.]|jgi:hypothetical protein